MTDAAVLDAETAFFEALLAADVVTLEGLLADDFLLVEVMAGQIVPRAGLLEMVGSKELEFLEIKRSFDSLSLRHRSGLAVVVGHSHMTMRHQGAEFATDSRYTHVYVVEGGLWRMLSAQGAPTTVS